jgi:hypothetical protein
VLSTRFDPLNNYISFGCDDGSIRIMKNREPYSYFHSTNFRSTRICVEIIILK